MSIWEIAYSACRVAADHYRLRDKSVVELTKATGYARDPDAITEQMLEVIFKENPDLIDSWWTLSGDKRVDQGWYLLRPFEQHNCGSDWVVGYFPGGPEQRFAEAARACAYFVKRELESYRKNPFFDADPEARKALMEPYMLRWR